MKKLTEIKTWYDRFKLNNPISWFILLSIWAIVFYFRADFIGWENFSAGGNVLQKILYLFVFLFCIWLFKFIPRRYQEILDSFKGDFKEEKQYKKFMQYNVKNFGSKWDFYLPVFGSSMYVIVMLVMDFLNKFEFIRVGGVSYNIPVNQRSFHIVLAFLNAFFIFIVLTLIFSTLMLLYRLFRSITKIGSKEYKIQADYKDLRIGVFDNIGRFIISVSIMVIIMFIGIGIVGFFTDKMGHVAGSLELYSGPLVSAIMIFFLYKSTMHIHESISQFKQELKESLLSKVNFHMGDDDPLQDNDITFAYSIHQLIEEIDKVRDWPFDPTSMKKFMVTIGSSIGPIVATALRKLL